MKFNRFNKNQQKKLIKIIRIQQQQQQWKECGRNINLNCKQSSSSKPTTEQEISVSHLHSFIHLLIYLVKWWYLFLFPTMIENLRAKMQSLLNS
jgi:hypothetical protein